jgi:hypothetical protein
LRRVLGPRFLVEVAFVVLVAAALWNEDVSMSAIFGAVAGAWLLVAFAEWLMSRRGRFSPRPDLAGDSHVTVTDLAERDTAPPAPPPVAPTAWNLWEIERRARGAAGADTEGDEERSFLLMHLREFADPDGMLPGTFDPLVREAFGDVLEAA